MAPLPWPRRWPGHFRRWSRVRLLSQVSLRTLAQPTVTYPEHMDDGALRLAADSGQLLRVLGRRTAQGYESLRLVFERGSLLLAVDADSDEIVVTEEATAAGNNHLPEVADDPVLSPLLGKVIESA